MRERRRTHRERLDRQDGRTAAEHAKPVLGRLGVEDGPARQADDAGLDALRVERDGRLERDGHLGARGDDGKVLALHLGHDVAALERAVERRALEVRQVLAREREDGRRLRARERRVVRGRRLVPVRGAPEVEVRRRAEVDRGLDRLMRGAVLTETDGVVGGCGGMGVRDVGRDVKQDRKITDRPR